jgi:hypothetical protein
MDSPVHIASSRGFYISFQFIFNFNFCDVDGSENEALQTLKGYFILFFNLLFL